MQRSTLNAQRALLKSSKLRCCQDHQIMCKDFHMHFPCSGLMAASAKGGAQSAFGPRDDAFGLPALAIFATVKTPLHLPSITCLGPTAAAIARVELDDCRADAQTLAGHHVIGFGVVAAVAQEAVDLQVPCCGQHRRLEQREVVAGSHAGQRRDNEMALGVADEGELGELGNSIASISITQALGIMRRPHRGFQTRGIDRRLGARLDQAIRFSIRDDRAQQAVKAPFFARRLRAWKRVVGCGIFRNSSASRRSDQSARSATMPRSSVLRNCSKASIARSWCWVKSFLENLDEYAGIASAEICRAFLANATGERVATRRFLVVSITIDTLDV